MTEINPRSEAMRESRGHGYSGTMATVYVGDQLARIADLLERQEKPRPDAYYEAIPTSEGMEGTGFIPGRLVTKGRE